MESIDVFSRESFDPKDYINELCDSKPEDVAIDRYLTDQELRLHIVAEDVGLYVHEESVRSTTKLPSAARELSRIQEDIEHVRLGIQMAMKGVDVRQEMGVYLELERLVATKRELEAERDRLQEAADLSSLFKTIDAMLRSDDLMRLADALGRFQRGLGIVGDASSTEFVQGKNKVVSLEERVLDLAVEKLDSSLKIQNGEHCKMACKVLGQLDKTQLIAQHYSMIRSQPLLDLWDGYSPENPFVSWIPTFYDEVLRSIASEFDWCSSYLEEYYPGIVLDMILTFFRRIDVPCKARLAGATSQSSISSLQSIEAMCQAMDSTADFVDALFDILRNSSRVTQKKSEEEELVKSIMTPYDDVLKHYPLKESNHIKISLDSIINSVRASSASTSRTTLHQGLVESIDSVYNLVVEALQRCASTTHGTALPALLDVLDSTVSKYMDSLPDILASSSCKGDISALLSLIPILSYFRSKVEALRSQMKEDVELLASMMEKFKHGAIHGGPESLSLRRISWNKDVERAIQKLCAGYSVSLLKNSDQAARRLNSFVEAMVDDGFMDKLRKHFDEVLVNKSYSEEKDDASTPNFSVYPLQYIISIGEQLMLLPQLLESSLVSNTLSEEEQEELVGIWIDRLTLVAATQYATELMKMKKLSLHGSKQIGADIEYFCNILTSLGQEIPVQISAWQAALASTDSEGIKSLLESIGDNKEAMEIVSFISRLRCIEL